MNSYFDDVFESWKEAGLEEKYMRPENRRFGLLSTDYSFRPARANDPSSIPRTVLFDPRKTTYGIVLHARGNDVALVGFNVTESIADVVQIQGGRHVLNYLAPVHWADALLNKLVTLCLDAELESVSVTPSYAVDGEQFDDDTKRRRFYESLEQKYDRTVERYALIDADGTVHRFASPTQELDRYVLRLRE